jgi:hypothetical protein
MALLMSSTSSSRPATVARIRPSSLSLVAAIGDQLSRLYGLAERSQHVFGTPLGPFAAGGRQHHLPRFVYFGPHTSEESPRLAFLAGLDRRDLRPTLALLHLIEELAVRPDLGQSLNVSFFPLVNVLGHLQPGRASDLAGEGWGASAAPEIDLLARDARLQNYHAFVRVETGPADDAVTLRLRASAAGSPSVPLVSSADFEPFAVRWEIDTDATPAAGPLSIGDDLAFRPLELTLRVPADWSPEFYREAVTTILKRFIIRYRGLLAYGQHL